MNRRQMIGATAGLVLAPGLAHGRERELASLRGSIDAAQLGVRSGSSADQTGDINRALRAAAHEDRALFLAPGRYTVSNLTLPPRSRIVGVPGATVLAFTGGDHMIFAGEAELVHLTDLVFDGAERPLADYVPGMVHLSNVADVRIAGCTFRRSAQSALALDRCGGRVTGNVLEDAAEAGIRAVESSGMSITDNVVRRCGNGGILVYRWTEGPDGTIVTGNRVEDISATHGGTGEWGNGVNVFRAHNVIVSGNRLARCAFSAVRANSANNVQILGNNCEDLGETALYSEFTFEGAVIANNIVQGASCGVSVANFLQGGRMAAVTGNVLRDITRKPPYPVDQPGFGVGIVVEADSTVTGNIVDRAGWIGVRLGWGPYLRDVAATSNVIRNAPIGVGVSVVEGSGSTIISDNLISGTSRAAIVGMRWAELATGDLARPGADVAPHILIDRNRIS